jgi:ammonium transporter, Amt family
MWRTAWAAGISLAMWLVPAAARADETVTQAEFVANNVWMMVCTALVFIMHLGFASLESGLSRSKNTVNILFKNVFVPLVGLLTHYAFGFSLMYPGEFDGVFGFAGFGLNPPENAMTMSYAASHGYTYYTDFLFQAMFAATCATIVSGAVAERIKLWSFMLFSTTFVGLVYTVGGSWKWGGGWLQSAGFHDFAGSTLVHSVGGWAALVGAMMLGPRIGKYERDGRVNPMIGSSMPMAVVGVFMLWLGWFGFNGGSVLSANPAATSLVLVNTCLAAAAGGIGAIFAYTFVSRKPDLSMMLNGILAGLVGVTAGADTVTPGAAIFIGGVSGALVVASVFFMDRVQVDDPVGAISVHLVCGIWGTLAVGLFSVNPADDVVKQLVGVVAYAAFTTISSFIIFAIIKATIGLRVAPDEELEGLDAGEHAMHAYDFLSSLGRAGGLPSSGPGTMHGGRMGPSPAE